MKPQELKIIKEFKQLTREVENIFMTEANDIISDALDLKGNQMYNSLTSTIKQLNNVMSKIVDYESTIANNDEFNAKKNDLYGLCESTVEQLEIKNFYPELLELVTSIVKPKMEEVYEFVSASKTSGFIKVHNLMKFEISKLYNNMKYLIKRIEKETLLDYRKLIGEAICEIAIKTMEKENEIQKFAESNIASTNEKIKLEKILDCNRMDRLLAQFGYKPVRQKGSHKIYKNEINTIPVPQHAALNKNLGYGIQKQVHNKK